MHFSVFDHFLFLNITIIKFYLYYIINIHYIAKKYWVTAF